jgi:ketosteroid isomerase-like protein
MIRFSANALGRVLIAGVTLLPVSAETPEEQIKQLERDRQAAFVRGDIARIEQETADDYTTINSTGSVSDKPRMMASLSSGRTKIVSVALEDLRARVYGEVAVLTGIYRDVSVSAGVERRTNARFTRVFAKRNGRWLAVAYQQTLIAD